MDQECRGVLRHALKAGYEFQMIRTQVEDINPLYGRDTYNGSFSRPTCAQLGCHDPLGRQESMILSPGRAYAMTVGVVSIETPQLARVTPGEI